MTKDNWSSNWPDVSFNEQLANTLKEEWNNKSPVIRGMAIATKQTSNNEADTKWSGSIDKAVEQGNDPVIADTLEKLIKANYDTSNLKKQGSNLVDDQEYLYFQCDGCDTILDPHTKSFKSLEDFRYKAGWKVKWNLSGMGYKVYCVKCGDKV